MIGVKFQIGIFQIRALQEAFCRKWISETARRSNFQLFKSWKQNWQSSATAIVVPVVTSDVLELQLFQRIPDSSKELHPRSKLDETSNETYRRKILEGAMGQPRIEDQIQLSRAKHVSIEDIER